MMKADGSSEKQGVNKGALSKEEDEKLTHILPQPAGGSSEKQGMNKGALSKEEDEKLQTQSLPQPAGHSFGEDEEDLIIKLHALLGDRWSLIAGRLPGRSGNEVKMYWNSHLKTKLESMGIDPENHRPAGINYVQSQNTTTSASTSTGSSCAATVKRIIGASQKSGSINTPTPTPTTATTSDDESDASSK